LVFQTKIQKAKAAMSAMMKARLSGELLISMPTAASISCIFGNNALSA